MKPIYEQELEKQIKQLSKIDKILFRQGYDPEGNKRRALKQSITTLTVQLTNYRNQ